MKKLIRLIAFMTVLAVALGSVSLGLAEGCGIGEAAVYIPSATAAPAAVSPASTGADPANLAPASADYDIPVAGDPEEDTGTRGFVTRMYSVVLGREPDPTGLETWVYQLESGLFGAADLVTRFFNSPEYQGKHKSSEAIVVDCYNAMLDRNPDPSGLEHWSQMLDVGMTSDKVCSGFLSSPEFKGLAEKYGIRTGTIVLTKARDQNYERTAFVYRLYKDCLERNPDLEGLEHWCLVLGLGGEGTSVARGFVFSKEYKGRHVTNEQYLDMLYQTIMGRNADAAGKNHWLNLLDYTTSRERVLNKFMFSVEFAGKCQKAGINVGRAIEEPDNTQSWIANITVLGLVNQERVLAGLDPLKTREDLWEDVAMVRAQEVSTFFSHTRPDGSSWYTAYTEAGFPQGMAAENIAYGYNTAASVVNAWMNSAGHRANILNPALTVLATGLYAYSNWSQNFYVEPY